MGSRELLPRRRCTSGTPAAAAGGPLSPPAPPWSGRDSPHPGETPRIWSKEVKKQELWQSPCFTLGLEETSLFPAFKTIWVCVACAYNLRGVLQIRWVTSVLGLPDEGWDGATVPGLPISLPGPMPGFCPRARHSQLVSPALSQA